MAKSGNRAGRTLKSQAVHCHPDGRSSEIRNAGLAFLGGYRGEGRHQLVYALATADWALDFGLFEIGNVEAPGEFLVAVLAVVEVLRHNSPPCHIIAQEAVDGRGIEEERANCQQCEPWSAHGALLARFSSRNGALRN